MASINYLQVDGLSKAYGEKTLFEDISFSLEKGQKTAIIARNGTGKTTLMNIIAGLDSADKGSIIFRNDLAISYLPQNPIFSSHQSILDVVFASESHNMQVVRQYELALATYQQLADNRHEKALNEAMAAMDAASAWDIETRAKEILGRFAIHNLAQPVSSLSGGQRKKIALARALLGEPDLIMLDEPTNHLDFEMIEWLEEYLADESLSLLLVTHDRYFLENVCDNILEMDKRSMYAYRGNYSYYLEKKSERETMEAQSVEKALNLYRTELEWVRRMPKARGTKSKSRLAAFGKLETLAHSAHSEKKIAFGVNERVLGGKIIEINNLSKSFDTLRILDDFSYIFKKGEKIGVVGLNGSGKSTLLNLIAGALPPDKGKISIGQTVVMSYYTQEGLRLHNDRLVIDVVRDVAEQITLRKGSMSATQFLHHFNFGYEKQQSWFSTLSGGEQRRLYLLLQLIRNPNFLMLDEPTNDLDIPTLQVLEEFLSEYLGCVLIVSHDRFLLDKLCDHVFVFEGNGRVKDFYGNYTDYYHWRIKEQRQSRLQASKIDKQDKPIASKPNPQKPTYKQIQAYEALEKEIGELEIRKADIEMQLNSGNVSVEALHSLSAEYATITERIDSCTDEWLKIAEIISSFGG